MNVRPLHDRIIVQRLEEPAPLPGAIITVNECAIPAACIDEESFKGSARV